MSEQRVSLQEVTDFISEKVGQKVKPLVSPFDDNYSDEKTVTLFVSENSPIVSADVCYLNDSIFVIGEVKNEGEEGVYYSLMYSDDFYGDTVNHLFEVGSLCVEKEGYEFDHIQLAE